METLREFWSNIENVRRSSQEDIQSDVLAYLDMLDDMNKRCSYYEGEVTALRNEVNKLQRELNAVNEAIQEGPQPLMTAEEWQVWLYSTLPFLEEDEING